MATEPSAVEQAVSRTLRENLESIQRTSNELHQAVGDFVAACASSRSLNALPPMIRAQMSAASLAATLEVLAGLVTTVLQPSSRGSLAVEALRAALPPEVLPASSVAEETDREPKISQPTIPHPAEELVPAAPVPVMSAAPKNLPPQEVAPPPQAMRQEPAIPKSQPSIPPPAPQLPVQVPVNAVVAQMAELVVQAVQNSASHQAEPAPDSVIQPVAVSHGTEDDSLWAPEAGANPEPEASPLMSEVSATPIAPGATPGSAANVFDIALLPIDQQELHRRANRVAKVSMQDIKMLRPDDVRLGRENRDLCTRLRDDIEKAHKEYDRRFQSIHSHPVDYFYIWMVEILAGGESEALGGYPYHSAIPRR
jgi:hypothetical protein